MYSEAIVMYNASRSPSLTRPQLILDSNGVLKLKTFPDELYDYWTISHFIIKRKSTSKKEHITRFTISSSLSSQLCRQINPTLHHGLFWIYILSNFNTKQAGSIKPGGRSETLNGIMITSM